MGDENPIRTLGDYSKPSHEGYRNTIELPVGNNVVPLRSDTIWDFAKPFKEITLPQDVPTTSNRRLIDLENQVQRLMEAHFALTQPSQVYKIITSCEICSCPHNTQYCMDDFEQAYIDYASSRTNEMGMKWENDMIRKINLLWKIVFENLNEKERSQKPVKVVLPKISFSRTIKELNKNPSAPKLVYFVNLIVILSKDSDIEEDVSSTNACRRDLGKMTKGNKEVKEQARGKMKWKPT
nr:MAK10-like protein [Tanacetum cinerariifolium]